VGVWFIALGAFTIGVSPQEPWHSFVLHFASWKKKKKSFEMLTLKGEYICLFFQPISVTIKK
jgi:hypothetical protein